MAKSSINSATLTPYLGKGIGDICKIGYSKASDNHCAHFVSHVMEYAFGPLTCATLNWTLKQAAKKLGKSGATLRVDDVFKKCREVGEWDDKKSGLKTCLAFITDKTNVNLRRKSMGNIPRKHIGIFCDAKIWHYSNSKNKVVNQTPAQFKKHYGSSSKYQLFFGTFPL